MRKALLAASAGVGIVALFVTTGTSLIPASFALGPCLKDRTSGVSYHARVSPLASADLSTGPVHLRVCYGRPSIKGRKVFGGLVPYGELWRTGANEPTRLYVDHAIQLGSLRVPAGRYSVYSKPAPEQWEVFVTRSVLHWGNDISESVRARELGSFTVPVTATAAPVETLTVAAESGNSSRLILEWEQTRVDIPVRPAP